MSKPRHDAIKEQFDAMVIKYGTSALSVSVDVHVTGIELVRLCGERCEDYERGCPVCHSYNQWNRNGKVSIELDRDQLLQIAYNS